jgi:hypothetical protein
MIGPAPVPATLMQLSPSALNCQINARISASAIASSDRNETGDPISAFGSTSSGSHINRHATGDA